MFYEISNVVSNHKYTERERQYNNPFSKTNKKTRQVYLVKDNPQYLFKVYSLGHCLRPHPFKDAKNADVNTIVLDFDNLTQLQYDSVKSIVTLGCFGLKSPSLWSTMPPTILSCLK